jgi:hypothetical protein
MLIPDWKRVLKKAWSIKLMLLAGLLSGLEILLPFAEDWLNQHDVIPRWALAFFAFVITAAAVVARLFAQPKMYRSDEDGK